MCLGKGPPSFPSWGKANDEVKLSSDSLRLLACLSLNVTLSLQLMGILQGKHLLCDEEMSVKFKNSFNFTSDSFSSIRIK